MTDIDELTLRQTIARREAVIGILERDLREAERKRRKLYDQLTEVCREELGGRCGILDSCENCPIKLTLEECK
ncbi:MAG: hypothetical protein IJU70_11930 [Lentisphaeria bacterium]|nr:hypothetical protein [Lentisphaeria bacterium]